SSASTGWGWDWPLSRTARRLWAPPWTLIRLLAPAQRSASSCRNASDRHREESLGGSPASLRTCDLATVHLSQRQGRSADRPAGLSRASLRRGRKASATIFNLLLIIGRKSEHERFRT